MPLSQGEKKVRRLRIMQWRRELFLVRADAFEVVATTRSQWIQELGRATTRMAIVMQEMLAEFDRDLQEAA